MEDTNIIQVYEKMKLNVNRRPLITLQTISILSHGVATPSRNNITAFFGEDSPLNYHHLAPQKIGKTISNCNEQYNMPKKLKLSITTENLKGNRPW